MSAAFFTKILNFIKGTRKGSIFALCVALFALWPDVGLAQPGRRDTIGWSEFLETYFDYEDSGAEEDEASERLAIYETLEEIHASPLNINTCTREDLMQLPFISGADADSIIAYRDRRGFLSLGELLFIRPLTYSDRLYLPLFVYVGERMRTMPSLREQLTKGKYELETRLDIPFYKREGNRAHTRSELEKYPNRAYHGNGLHNVLRFRYKYGSAWEYGLTFDKDAGEPFAAEGNIPYDYASFYIHHRSSRRHTEWILGDYEVRIGQGLLFGNGFFLGKTTFANGTLQSGFRLKSHTSTEENNFLRGVAGRFPIGKRMNVAAFASWRTLDASYRGDTILTLQTSGLHRTQSEIDRKDYATALTLGSRVGYLYKGLEAGITAYVTHFTHPVYPDLRYYNAGYFRGQTAAGFSLDYSWHSDRWDLNGEMAADHKAHLAYAGQMVYRASDAVQLFLQHRHLSSRFVSLYGHTVQEGSRCANEHGGLVGITAQMKHGFSMTAYADVFVLPKPTYLNHQRTRGVEAYLQANLRRNSRTWQLIYRYKSKERSISGHTEQSEFVQTHRGTLRLSYTARRLSLYPSLTACLRIPQTGDASFGWMAALRGTWKSGKKWQIGGFAAVFMSDDYASALYAYEPQLPHQSAIPSFFYHGMRLAATVRTLLPWGLEAGLRIGSTHYFNRDEISSGTQLIRSSWKNDLSLQLRWRFDAWRKSRK